MNASSPSVYSSKAVSDLYVAGVNGDTRAKRDDDFVAEGALHIALELPKTSSAVGEIVQTNSKFTHPRCSMSFVCNRIQCGKEISLCIYNIYQSAPNIMNEHMQQQPHIELLDKEATPYENNNAKGRLSSHARKAHRNAPLSLSCQFDAAAPSFLKSSAFPFMDLRVGVMGVLVRSLELRVRGEDVAIILLANSVRNTNGLCVRKTPVRSSVSSDAHRRAS